jgi:iron(III) transport system ATP-binding protein
MTETMLKFTGVSHRYGATPSVSDVSLEIAKGQVVSLLGPSGSGKSTILRLAAGLEQPQSGEIYLNDRLVASPQVMISPEDRGIGLVFQDYALFPHMSVFDNIRYGLKRSGLTASQQEKRVCEVLDHVDLSGFQSAMPHELSGGEQQRVALARALAPAPELILLDEPYAGLDSRLRERIRDDMLHILKEAGTAALLVTHDSEEAMFMSDNITVIREGRLEQSGRPIDLYCRPSNAFVAEFFGEVNRLDGFIKKGCIQTPFGNFPVPNAEEGAEASMIIRYEGLTVNPEHDEKAGSARAEVMEARLLGRYSLIHFSMPQKEGSELHLHARVPGLNMFSPGDAVTLSLDETHVFVFRRRQQVEVLNK